jgi:hypothetical protein
MAGSCLNGRYHDLDAENVDGTAKIVGERGQRVNTKAL